MPRDPFPETATNGEAKPRFKPVRFKDIKASRQPPYLVKGLLPREGLAVIYGPPKCCKTFWIFDVLMHIAFGWDYRGRRVQAGTSVYIACEGERGLAARKEAFSRRSFPKMATPIRHSGY